VDVLLAVVLAPEPFSALPSDLSFCASSAMFPSTRHRSIKKNSSFLLFRLENDVIWRASCDIEGVDVLLARSFVQGRRQLVPPLLSHQPGRPSLLFPLFFEKMVHILRLRWECDIGKMSSLPSSPFCRPQLWGP